MRLAEKTMLAQKMMLAENGSAVDEVMMRPL
jgi:hypothetical protein